MNQIFEDISIEYDQDTLFINVKELPIIQNIILDGIKAKNLKLIKKNFKFKSRSSLMSFTWEKLR